MRFKDIKVGDKLVYRSWSQAKPQEVTVLKLDKGNMEVLPMWASYYRKAKKHPVQIQTGATPSDSEWVGVRNLTPVKEQS